MVKRYFVVTSLKSELPYEFVNSREKRHISVLGIKLLEKDTGRLLMDISAHGDFIIDSPDFNGFVCFCNEQLAKRKKWEILHQPRYINLEFRRLDTLELIDPSIVSFVAEFLLEF